MKFEGKGLAFEDGLYDRCSHGAYSVVKMLLLWPPNKKILVLPLLVFIYFSFVGLFSDY